MVLSKCTTTSGDGRGNGVREYADRKNLKLFSRGKLNSPNPNVSQVELLFLSIACTFASLIDILLSALNGPNVFSIFEKMSPFTEAC